MYTGNCDSCGKSRMLTRMEVFDEDGEYFETFLVCEECEPEEQVPQALAATRPFDLAYDSPVDFVTWN